jgi:hypothetical protein
LLKRHAQRYFFFFSRSTELLTLGPGKTRSTWYRHPQSEH